jgi:hypothetical protein
LQTRGPGLLGTDATGIPILDPAVRDGVRTGTIWCWTNARWVSFVYAPKGDADSVHGFLGEDLMRSVSTPAWRRGNLRASRELGVRPVARPRGAGGRVLAEKLAEPKPTR